MGLQVPRFALLPVAMKGMGGRGRGLAASTVTAKSLRQQRAGGQQKQRAGGGKLGSLLSQASSSFGAALWGKRPA